MRVLVVLAILLSAAAPAMGQSRSERLEGRRLAEALRALQARGLRIVFSSEIVTADMRVSAEPRATSARQVLDELLTPHGLKAQEGPGSVIQVIRARPSTAAPRRPTAPTPGGARGQAAPAGAAARGAATYSERVLVTSPPIERHDPGVAADVSLESADLQNMRGLLVDDPLRAVQTLPRVASGDDFRSEFSVRGSPYRHVGVVVDGVPTRWLQHSADGRGDSGSVAMLNSDVLEQATLQAGAYPHRYGDRLGAQLGLTLRQGSRSATGLRGVIGASNATLVGEGPIGRSERGSWLATMRSSYLDWPISRHADFHGTVFGIADAQAKLVYDVRPSQQVSFTMLAGRSSLDEQDDRPPSELADGSNRTTVLNLAWRSTFGSRSVLSQRAYLVAHEFRNDQAGQDGGRGRNRDLSYRADIARTMFGGVFEAGAQVQRIRASQHAPAVGAFDGSSWLRSGYAHVTWRATPWLTVAPGLRFTDSSLVRRRTLSRWILGEWSLGSSWRLNASAGVSHQFPEVEHVLGGAGAANLRPERSTPIDVGIERRFGGTLRWQATFFNRLERDILREPDVHPRLVGDALVEPLGADRHENSLNGSSRGLEFLVDRRSATGLTGWIAYSYGRSRHADASRNESFWADFDQRHAINAWGAYRLSERTNVGVRFRGGTNFPVPGYLVARDGTLFAGSERNIVRLPHYARLDARATRTFTYGRRRLTLFLEVLNVLNRTNLRRANGAITRETGEAIGFTETLFPRLPAGGIVIEF